MTTETKTLAELTRYHFPSGQGWRMELYNGHDYYKRLITGVTVSIEMMGYETVYRVWYRVGPHVMNQVVRGTAPCTRKVSTPRRAVRPSEALTHALGVILPLEG